MAAKKSGSGGRSAGSKASGSKGSSKQTSSRVSTIASGILSGKIKPTIAQIKSVAASALGQDQTKGQGKKER
jgi:hypothetical protein